MGATKKTFTEMCEQRMHEMTQRERIIFLEGMRFAQEQFHEIVDERVR